MPDPNYFPPMGNSGFNSYNADGQYRGQTLKDNFDKTSGIMNATRNNDSGIVDAIIFVSSRTLEGLAGLVAGFGLIVSAIAEVVQSYFEYYRARRQRSQMQLESITAHITSGKNINEKFQIHGGNQKFMIKEFIGTYLHYAAYQDLPTVIYRLRTLGADPTIQDNQNRTPLDVALERSNKSAIRILRKWMPKTSNNAENGNRNNGTKVLKSLMH